MRLIKTELAKRLGISRQHLDEHINASCIKPDKNKRYDIDQLKRYLDVTRDRDNRLASLPIKDKKTALECKYLSEKIKIITKDYISTTEHIDHINAYSNYMLSALNEVKQYVAAMFPDHEIQKKWAEVERKTRLYIISQVENDGNECKKEVSNEQAG